jgi:hypothetical protein
MGSRQSTAAQAVSGYNLEDSDLASLTMRQRLSWTRNSVVEWGGDQNMSDVKR